MLRIGVDCFQAAPPSVDDCSVVSREEGPSADWFDQSSVTSQRSEFRHGCFGQLLHDFALGKNRMLSGVVTLCF